MVLQVSRIMSISSPVRYQACLLFELVRMFHLGHAVLEGIRLLRDEQHVLSMKLLQGTTEMVML